MADEADIKFYLIDQTGTSPTSQKPGGTGPGAAPPRQDFDDAAGKASGNNDRNSGSRWTGDGSRSSARGASPMGSPAESNTRDKLLSSTADLVNAAKGAITGGGSIAQRVVGLAKPAAEVAYNARTAIVEARAANTAAQAAAKAAPLAKAMDDGMLGMGGASTSTAATTASTTTVAATAGRAASAAGPIGLAVAAAALAAAGVAAPFVAAANRMSQASEQLADFSPEVARARAQADVRAIRDSLRSAERIGTDTADFTDAVSRLSSQLQDIKDSFVTAVGPEVNAMLDSLVIIAEGARSLARLQERGNDFWREKLGVNRIYSYLDMIAKALTKSDEMNFIDFFEKQPWILPPGFNNVGQPEVANVNVNPIPGLEL